MRGRSRWITPLAIVIADIVILTSLLASGMTGWPFWSILTAVVLSLGSVLVPGSWRIFFGGSADDAQDALAAEQQLLREQYAAFEELRSRSAVVFDEQSRRLQQRERELAKRLGRLHEFLEYPVDDPHAALSSDELIRLSDHDREVNRLLESEAERVYEKIRVNGYMPDGRLDVESIREELFQLVQRIARIYSPQSKNPLLETSFEQLARAGSRICLHVLVLMEQLPLNVQQYNFNNLYVYLRTAVQGYGTYKKAAPWIKYLTRGMYVGRVLSTTNPVAMGAWWLASEVGRKGAQRLVENMIDRQAVAVLHDLVTVIGVEVASIYGTGFRHRDTAWVLGSELVELISQFPPSRESLREGLRQITALPLRNEYDRIYLYRCLAGRRSAHLQLSDPAMLTREERETIAARLEQFFAAHIHGATVVQTRKWRDSFEERFDLRLNLSSSQTAGAAMQQVCESLISVTSFLSSVAGLSISQAVNLGQTGRLAATLTDVEREEFLPQLDSMVKDRRFEPPNLEPASSITDLFLNDLARSVVRISSELQISADPSLEQLIVETGAYFRRSPVEMRTLIDSHWVAVLRELTTDPAVTLSEANALTARSIIVQMTSAERIAFCFSDIQLRISSDHAEFIPDACFVGLLDISGSERRTLLLMPGHQQPGHQLPEPAVWCCEGSLTVDREKGLLIDSAVVSGGHWMHVPISSQPLAIVISGSLRGGRYKSYFRPLLQFAE